MKLRELLEVLEHGTCVRVEDGTSMTTLEACVPESLSSQYNECEVTSVDISDFCGVEAVHVRINRPHTFNYCLYEFGAKEWIMHFETEADASKVYDLMCEYDSTDGIFYNVEWYEETIEVICTGETLKKFVASEIEGKLNLTWGVI